jgi:hypothetical protein
MELIVEFAWWTLRGAGFCAGWIITNAIVGLIGGRRAPG